MPLLADPVGLGQPGRDLVIDLRRVDEPEAVDLVARRDDFDASEARTVQAARQHDVAVNPMSPQSEGRKAHADLKGDAGLLGQHLDGTCLPCDRQQLPEGPHNLGVFAREMVPQTDLAADVKLVAIRKAPTAGRTGPQRPHRRGAYDHQP
ncbi:MAG TPA: hypothetical protein VFO75_03620 [Candidatus Dormibacteraeota bacterium]|nr:hypothetical protein [Candidatus Dormibacteraeota bacterium]